MKLTTKNLELGVYATAVLLSISVFLPLTDLPVYGDVTYNKVAEIESYLVIFFALSAPVLIFLEKIKLVWTSVAGVWVTLLFPAIKGIFKTSDDSLLSNITDKATNVMSEFAGDLFLNIFEFNWGGFIFLIALILYTSVCILRVFK